MRLLLSGTLSLIALNAALAEPLVFEAQRLEAAQLSGMTTPALIDAAVVEASLDSALADLQALERMVVMLDDARARAALTAQAKALTARLQASKAQLKASAYVAKAVDLKPRLVQRPCPPCAHQARAPRGPQPMSAEDFTMLKEALSKASYSKERINLLSSLVNERWFSVNQAKDIAKVFSFSKSRIKALVMIYPRLVNPEDAFQLYDVFDYSSDRDKLREKIEALKAAQAPAVEPPPRRHHKPRRHREKIHAPQR
ncbi:DUF4476 domain-containing protein [Myxococcota bacterium]|nr:DUF4476 domain-containing protein [Myxococcota bacterium]MBU1429421.1 DUF4476 domain-containing protein [Myxococcota bacterium]MBU1899393.1 DUF4476 domain-containing protein [Myxococcota bacterium]